MTETDLVIVDGGVMGLFTAYYASELAAASASSSAAAWATRATASHGRTRSYRNDYLDPTYVRLAREAIAPRADGRRAASAPAPRRRIASTHAEATTAGSRNHGRQA